MVTGAVRRVNLDRSKETLFRSIDPNRYFLLPNTAGCYTADDTIRTARLAREVGLSDWIKLEVIGDQATLYPDVQATLEATSVLAKEGFTVLAYTSDDIVFAKRLVDAGASAVMPLGAPIGSGLGIQNAANLRILRELITGVPLIVAAGGDPRRSTKNIGGPPRSPYSHLLDSLLLKHFDTVNVDLVAVDVPSHGNMMSFVTLEGIRIVHRQDLLVSVANHDRAGAGCDAFLCASLRTRVGSLNATLRVADPAVHGLGI